MVTHCSKLAGFGNRLGPRGGIAQHAGRRVENAHVLQGVGGLERIVVELAAVEDARHARAGEHRLIEHFVPQQFDFLHLGEEAMAADVKAIAFTFDGSGDSADDGIGFKDGSADAVLGKFVRRRQARGACANDDRF